MINYKLTMNKKSGQIVIVLLLTMLVALAVGLTVTQRSITDISTSTQSDQSSRAIAAAEAGLERVLSKGGAESGTIPAFDLGNQSTAEVKTADNLPKAKQALEYPPIDKGSVAQFWLADPTTSPPATFYTQTQIDIYFGSSPASSVKPALEVSLVYKDTSGNYQLAKRFIDPDPNRRTGATPNGFIDCTTQNPTAINTTSSRDSSEASRSFLCKYNFDFTTITGYSSAFLIRARVLYATDSQQVAVKPYNPGVACAAPFNPCSLPPQATIYTSTGKSGQSQKTLQVFKTKMVPAFFDYAVFSTGEIIK